MVLIWRGLWNAEKHSQLREGAAMTADLYDDLAEFHDLFMKEPWEALRPAVREVVGGLGPDDVVVDLGAGTGMGTRVIAAETAANLVAVEPSRMMRTALMARVAGDQALAERVTVVAGLVTFTPDVLADGAVVEQRHVGRYLYEAHYLETLETDTFLSEDVVKDRDRVIRSERFTGPWLSLPSDRLAEELGGAGLTLTVAGPSWGLVRKDAR
jgi:hypothetical protein